MNKINLTPHMLHIFAKDRVITLMPSGNVARAVQTSTQIGTIDDIPVFRNKYGAIEGLPDPQPDTIYIVSALAAQACPEREDVFITADPVRDDTGRIIGCRALAHI